MRTTAAAVQAKLAAAMREALAATAAVARSLKMQYCLLSRSSKAPLSALG
jgi:hypothetical protein